MPETTRTEGNIPTAAEGGSIHCPRCHQPLPEAGAGELHAISLAELVEKRYPEEPTVRYDPQAKTVDIFGGGSGYTKDNPYSIDAARVTRAEKLAGWMCHILSKRWAFGKKFMEDLGQALLRAMQESQKDIDPSRIHGL